MPSERVHMPSVQGPHGEHQVPGLGEDAGEVALCVQVLRSWLSGQFNEVDIKLVFLFPSFETPVELKSL